MTLRAALVLVLVVFSVSAINAQSGFVDGVSLTTIKAPWHMRILGGDLDLTQVQAKPDQQSAYFMMTSRSTKLNVSVFIEPVDKCSSSEACRDHVLSLGNPAWGKYQDPAKGKIKDFSYFEFYRPEVKGQPVKMLDMYAQYVADGYWVDLHISKVLYKKEDHALFERLVNSVSFVKKSAPEAADPFAGEIATGNAAAASWLVNWDTGKCRETFLGMSSVTRKENTESDWVEYCTRVNSSLGAKRSRELIAAAFTRSLPPKTDQPVAILAYHSTFAKVPDRPGIELLGLMLEKNGKWTVTNYVPQ